MNKSKSDDKHNIEEKDENEDKEEEEKRYEISFDKIFHSTLSEYIGWFSPASFFLAFSDWFIHFRFSIDKQTEILFSALDKYQHFYSFCFQACFSAHCKNIVECKHGDARFDDKLWHVFPFNIYSQHFLIWEEIWDEATRNVVGVSKHHEKVVNFMARQLLDIYSPSNFTLTNPEVLKTTFKKKGKNFEDGINNFIEDFVRLLEKKPPVGTEDFQVGKDVAVTKGKVIFRNKLIELIQYEPKTEHVYKEPILIVPAWIMKYYILDLSPKNSLVKYLVEQGHTVFMISWKNPDSDYRDMGLDDYMEKGVLAALDTVKKIMPNTKINTIGYCIGGTLLMIAAAYLAKKDEDNMIKSITLFATQIDFKDAGELLLFIDDSQVTYIENIMWKKGYLDGAQMAGTFSMLRPIKLIWSRVIKEYLMGERQKMFDLMAWDHDTTRLPFRMHSEYLRELFLDNNLVQGKFKIKNKNLALLDITLPVFSVSTITDHVAPWKSVYKIHNFMETDITFVLTSGGHNAGIVSEIGHPDRTYQIKTTLKSSKRLSSDKWKKDTPKTDGSWWPELHKWLSEQSEGLESPPKMGNKEAGLSILEDAPGKYVFEK